MGNHKLSQNFVRVAVEMFLPLLAVQFQGDVMILKLIWGQVTHICVSELPITGSDNCLSPGWRQAIIWTNIVNSKLKNKLQWNLKRNSYIFIQENPFENVVWKMASILSQCVKHPFHGFRWLHDKISATIMYRGETTGRFYLGTREPILMD